MHIQNNGFFYQVVGVGAEAGCRCWNSGCSKCREKYTSQCDKCCSANNSKLSIYNLTSKLGCCFIWLWCYNGCSRSARFTWRSTQGFWFRSWVSSAHRKVFCTGINFLLELIYFSRHSISGPMIRKAVVLVFCHWILHVI